VAATKFRVTGKIPVYGKNFVRLNKKRAEKADFFVVFYNQDFCLATNVFYFSYSFAAGLLLNGPKTYARSWQHR
jgi:hypothetical protein